VCTRTPTRPDPDWPAGEQGGNHGYRHLVPNPVRRMLSRRSQTFYRGAALIMAADLAPPPYRK